MRHFKPPVIVYVILILIILSSLRIFIQGSQDYSDGLIEEAQLQKMYLNDVPYSKETEAETGQNGSLIIKKALYCNVWHTECDVMGDQYWVKDEISNPEGNKSKEGHRKDHCGAVGSWYVYLNEYGEPYAMLEMKAGSTNDLIPLPAHFYTDNTYTELRDPATIEAEERIYWTTENKGQVWHHTGVTRLDIPKFEFIIDGESYSLQPDESIEIEVSAGYHTIVEKYDEEYIINDVSVPFQVDEDEDVVISIFVPEGTQVEVDFENRPRHMPKPPDPPQTEPITETETQTEVETQTESETETETEEVTESESEPETETDTEVITESESETEPVIESETEETETEESETEESEESEVEETEESEISKSEDPNDQNDQDQDDEDWNNDNKDWNNDNKDLDDEEDQDDEDEQKSAIRKKIEEKIVKIYGNSQKSPKTGDDSPLSKFICSLLLSFIVIIILAYCINNRRD